MSRTRQLRQGVHYLCYLTGNGTRCYEWLSRETGVVRRWHGTYHEFLYLWGHDVATLPTDWVHA